MFTDSIALWGRYTELMGRPLEPSPIEPPSHHYPITLPMDQILFPAFLDLQPSKCRSRLALPWVKCGLERKGQNAAC